MIAHMAYSIEKETLYNIGIMAKKRLNEDISKEYKSNLCSFLKDNFIRDILK